MLFHFYGLPVLLVFLFPPGKMSIEKRKNGKVSGFYGASLYFSSSFILFSCIHLG
jgi:hypothetical protein